VTNDTVPASDVISVLQNSPGVFIVLLDEANHLYAIESETSDYMEAVVLKGPINKRMLFRLKAKLKIPVHFFWHPEMVAQRVKAKAKNK